MSRPWVECPARVSGMHGTTGRDGCCLDCGRRVHPPTPAPARGQTGMSELTEAYGEFYDPDFGTLTPDQIRNVYRMGQDR